MVKVEMTFYEITDEDFTGVHVAIYDGDGDGAEIHSEYSNFSEEELEDMGLTWYANQTTIFTLPSVDVAVDMFSIYELVGGNADA